MVWESRGSSNQYFYRSKRLPDGRVRKLYFGSGFRAHSEWMRLVAQRAQKKREKQIKEAFLELDSVAASHAKATQLLMEAQLHALGYHNPRYRGWRRRSESMIKPVQQNQVTDNIDEPTEVTKETVNLQEVIQRCRAGDHEAVKTLRKVMKHCPELFEAHGHVTAKVQTTWIRALSGPDLFDREMILSKTRDLREGLLAEGGGSHLERLVVDQVVTTHLEQGFHGLMEARCLGKGIEMPKYQLEASQRATRRYEKSLSALSTIRELAPKLGLAREVDVEEPAPEEPLNHPTWQDAAVTNRLTSMFEKPLEPVPMN